MIASRIHQFVCRVYPHICWENNCLYFVRNPERLNHAMGTEETRGTEVLKIVHKLLAH